MTWFMNGSLGNIHGLQFLGIARGNLKLGAGLVIMKVLLWNMDNKPIIYSSSNEKFSSTKLNWYLSLTQFGIIYFKSWDMDVNTFILVLSFKRIWWEKCTPIRWRIGFIKREIFPTFEKGIFDRQKTVKNH